MATRRQSRGSRLGTFLVLAGVLGVLGATFVAGVWTGRHWPVLWGGGKPPATAEPTVTRKGAAPERPKAAGSLPALTFYQELKAPLTAPPPPLPKPGKTPPPLEAKREEPKREEARRDEPKREEARREEVERSEPAPPVIAAAAPAAPEAGVRFTVQVAAYNARPPADALRTTLAGAGHDARVVEAETPAGVRYRVQVGAFPTREAARDAAARLATERALSTFVTTR